MNIVDKDIVDKDMFDLVIFTEYKKTSLFDVS